MPFVRSCPTCRAKVPANLWDAHRQTHKNERVNPRHSDEYRHNRRTALKRDRYRCTVCGVTATQLRAVDQALETDHVNGDPSDHRVGNLRAVCPDHNPRGGSRPGRGL